MAPQQPGSAPRTRNDERRERTRERLLQATLDLLRLEGMGAVSVSRITKRVGVHHSLFYAHFKTLEECLAVVAGRVLEKLAPMDRALRRDVLARSLADRTALAQLFETTLDRWLEQGPLVELLLAHRLDQSALGQTLRPAMARMRDELAAELWNVAAKLGVEGRHLSEVRALADLFWNDFLWALELLLEGRAHDRAELGRMLADAYLAQSFAAFRRMLGPSRETIVAARFSPAQRQHLDRTLAGWRERVAAYDDAALIAQLGGAEAVVDAVLHAMSTRFLPALAAGRSAIVAYMISAPQDTICRRLVIDHDACAVDAGCDGRPARCTLALSLRVLLETSSNLRSFNEVFGTGELRVQGDVLFSAELLDWFYR